MCKYISFKFINFYALDTLKMRRVLYTKKIILLLFEIIINK